MESKNVFQNTSDRWNAESVLKSSAQRDHKESEVELSGKPESPQKWWIYENRG